MFMRKDESYLHVLISPLFPVEGLRTSLPSLCDFAIECSLPFVLQSLKFNFVLNTMKHASISSVPCVCADYHVDERRNHVMHSIHVSDHPTYPRIQHSWVWVKHNS